MTNPWELSERQEQVVRTLTSGDCRKDVADKLGMAYKTLDTHLHLARAKMGAKSKTHAVLMFDRWVRSQ